MGFEDFAVLLYPTDVSKLQFGIDVRSLEEIITEVRNTLHRAVYRNQLR
jgi:hypothetical protein